MTMSSHTDVGVGAGVTGVTGVTDGAGGTDGCGTTIVCFGAAGAGAGAVTGRTVNVPIRPLTLTS